VNEYKKASREYLITLLTSLKKARSKLQEQKTLADQWIKRVDLARTHGRADLQAEAEKRLGEILENLHRLEGEEKELRKEFRAAQTRYDIEAALPEKIIDPDLLLEQLIGTGGSPDPLQEEINSLSVETELEELKRQMGKKE
jgi:regulator of sirC expression with transglutaminase-like and TPR domain